MSAVRWRGGALVVATILCLVAAPALLGSCAHGTCSKAGDDASFVGLLTARRAGLATFTVESVTVLRTKSSNGPIPDVATPVDVRYPESQARFLRVGTRYHVSVFWTGLEFTSGVHLADDPCSGGTAYADGSGIDTSRFPWLGKALVAVALTPVVALLITIVVVRRRRRPTTVRVDDRYL